MKIRLFVTAVLLVAASAGLVNAAPGSPVTPPANNQIASRDAIAVRVVPNPEHYSPLQWYNSNIKVKGAPQSLIVDGYEAVRDGRTVYVNAAKVSRVKRCNGTGMICVSDRQCDGLPNQSDTRLPGFLVKTAFAASCIETQNPVLYTNIYIISFNQDPETATTDIFGQLLQFWKFNTDIKNCSNDATKLCTQDAECNGRLGTAVCQPTGTCSVSDKSCLLDSDCPTNESCRNKKSAVIHDVRRLADLRAIKDRLETYNAVQKTYPALAQGTYVSNSTISTWPSWQTTFKNAIGGDLPIDPVNKLGACAGSYNPVTCWDEAAKRYASTNNPLAVPTGSFVYYYQYNAVGNTYKFCGHTESGFIEGSTVGSPICDTHSCAGRQCGTDGSGTVCGTCSGTLTCQNYKCTKDVQQQQQDN